VNLGCRVAGHDPVMVTVWRSDGCLSWVMCCSRCGSFDEFGTSPEQSDAIWRLLMGA
jgi:hypothetical protein